MIMPVSSVSLKITKKTFCFDSQLQSIETIYNGVEVKFGSIVDISNYQRIVV